MHTPFKFKQFSTKQNQCAMKIGTDSVLLGAWAPIKHNPFSILDIGAGTGILSLMLAQRSHAQIIEALEIDDNAFEQCVDNFEQSQWNDRLFCYHASLQEFADEIEDTYELIICNPPFYSEDYKTGNLERDLARFQDAMPFEHLLESVAKLLSKNGLFSVIVPYSEETKFTTIANQFELYCEKITRIKGTATSKIKRSLLTLSFTTQEVIATELIIETSRHNYTDDYVNLTKDFYLKM
jgi:tRNA1Val (adenine37-N6)-methyltransferase